LAPGLFDEANAENAGPTFVMIDRRLNEAFNRIIVVIAVDAQRLFNVIYGNREDSWRCNTKWSMHQRILG
jgi:hypothetical protein